MHNVFLYRSFANGLLLRELADTIPPSLLFILGLAIIGYFVRKRPLFESALLYLVALVVLSPAMANQYLAIPMPAVAAQMNLLHGLYTLVASLIMVSNPDGLGLGLDSSIPGADVGELAARPVRLRSADRPARLRNFLVDAIAPRRFRLPIRARTSASSCRGEAFREHFRHAAALRGSHNWCRGPRDRFAPSM